MRAVLYSVTVNDRVAREIKARLADLNRAATIVGWPGEGSPLHITYGNRGELVTTHLTVAQVAGIHELGSMAQNIPSRPIMRRTISLHKRDIPEAARKIYLDVLRGTWKSRSTQVAMAQLGLFWARKVKGTFTEARFARLDRKTIARRVRRGNTSDRPLVDYGHLRDCVDHRMVGAGYQ